MHTIRLRHPWKCELVGDTTLWSRKFNWPAELASGEIVQLVVEPIALAKALSLNETQLTSKSDGRFGITSLIAKCNLLAITSSAGSSGNSEQCPFDVRLEIVGG